jgi:hypothetical protein
MGCLGDYLVAMSFITVGGLGAPDARLLLRRGVDTHILELSVFIELTSPIYHI